MHIDHISGNGKCTKMLGISRPLYGFREPRLVRRD
jgi:hypothetical protein